MNATAFDNGSAASSATCNTASKFWDPTKTYFVTVLTWKSGGTPAVPTFDGVANVGIRSSPQTTTVAQALFIVNGDGTTGAKVIDCGGVVQNEIQYVISEWDELVTAVQIVANDDGGASPPPATVTLAAFTTGTATFVAAANMGSSVESAGAGMTLLSHNTAFFDIAGEEELGANLTPQMLSTPASGPWTIFGVEVAPAASFPFWYHNIYWEN